MKKVLVSIKAFYYLIKCKCQLAQLAHLLNQLPKTQVPNHLALLKLFSLTYQLYWVPFRVEVEPNNDETNSVSFLLLEDALYYLPALLSYDGLESFDDALQRWHNGYFHDTLLDAIQHYMADLRYSLNKYNCELA